MKARLVLLLGLVMALSLVAAPAAAAHGPSHHGSLPSRIDLPDGFSPEGITKGRGSTFYVGSLVDGAIWKGSFKTGKGRILVPGVAGQVAVGTEYDALRGRLWVAGGPTGLVRVYNARTGRLLQTYDFGLGGFLNDLVVTRKAVYVTDSLNQRLDVIPLGWRHRLPAPSKAFKLPLSGDITYIAGFNANGIVARHGWLILVQSNTGQLFRVNPRTGVGREIKLLGVADVTFGDGLELNGRTLFVVRNQLNLVAVLKLSWSLRSARWQRDLTSPGNLDIPTTAAFALNKLWVVNARFGTPVTPTTDYWITRLSTKH